MSELPRGWEKTTIGAVSDIKLGKMLDSAKNTGSPRGYLRNINVRWGHFNLDSILEMPFTEDEIEAFGIRKGDLLVCEGGEPGRCAVWQGVDMALQFQKALMRLRPCMGISPFFLEASIKNLSRSDQLRNYFTGTTIKHLPRSSLSAVSLPLPPLAEQQRIVAKLDALSAKSARARTELARIETLVSRYKQAVLNKAFSKELESRELRTLVSRIKAGKNLRCEERTPRPEEIGVVKVSAVTWGKFRPDQSKTLPEDFEPDADTRIRNGDFLFSRANTLELVGAVVIVDDAPENLFLSDKILRIEFREPVERWILWYLRSPAGRAALMNASSGNQLSMRNIGQKSLLSLQVPYANRRDREEIVRRIEAAFARIDRLATEAKRALTLVGKLDEAILAKAFRGELVPQDESDEPASVLLERIRAERASAPKAKRGGGRGARAGAGRSE